MRSVPLLVIIPAAGAALAAIIAIVYRKFPLHLIYKSKVGYESMLDAIGDPLAVIAPDYTVTRANKAYVSLVSGSFQSVIGAKCYSLLKGLSEPCADCRIPVVESQRRPEVVERTQHPSGSGAVRLSFSPFPQPESPDTHFIIEHIRDISQLEELKGNLEEKNRILAGAMRDLRAAQREIRDELRLARQVQEGIMPKQAPAFGGLSIAIAFHSVEEIGGDLYDFIPISDDELGVFVGDASGHGFSASLIGMIAKMSLFNNSKRALSPAELMAAINRDLFTIIQTSHYLTCVLGVFNRVRHTFTYCRAGHPMPVVVRRDRSALCLEASGPFAGIIEDAAFEQAVFAYEPGDRFFIFTDGIYERRRGDERSFGYDRFTELLQTLGDTPFGKVIDLVEERFAGYACDDDSTLLVIEADPPGGPGVATRESLAA
jgi:serine phosphatase RsbU (regulator of sigma subunit)